MIDVVSAAAPDVVAVVGHAVDADDAVVDEDAPERIC